MANDYDYAPAASPIDDEEERRRQQYAYPPAAPAAAGSAAIPGEPTPDQGYAPTPDYAAATAPGSRASLMLGAGGYPAAAPPSDVSYPAGATPDQGYAPTPNYATAAAPGSPASAMTNATGYTPAASAPRLIPAAQPNIEPAAAYPAGADVPTATGQPAPRPQWKDYQPAELHGWRKGLGALFTGMAGFGNPKAGQEVYNRLFVDPRKRAEENYKNATSEYDTTLKQNREANQPGRYITPRQGGGIFSADENRWVVPPTPTNQKESPTDQRKDFAADNHDMFQDDNERKNFVLYGHAPQKATANPNEWQTRIDAANGDKDAQRVLAQRFGEEKTLAGIRATAGTNAKASAKEDQANAEGIASKILNEAKGDPDKALQLFDQHSPNITDPEQKRLGPEIRKAIRARKQINTDPLQRMQQWLDQMPPAQEQP